MYCQCSSSSGSGSIICIASNLFLIPFPSYFMIIHSSYAIPCFILVFYFFWRYVRILRLPFVRALCDGPMGGCLEQLLSGFFTSVISRKEQPISSFVLIAMVVATTSPQHVVFCRCGEKGNLKAPTGRLGWSTVAKWGYPNRRVEQLSKLFLSTPLLYGFRGERGEHSSN